MANKLYRWTFTDQATGSKTVNFYYEKDLLTYAGRVYADCGIWRAENKNDNPIGMFTTKEEGIEKLEAAIDELSK